MTSNVMAQRVAQVLVGICDDRNLDIHTLEDDAGIATGSLDVALVGAPLYLEEMFAICGQLGVSLADVIAKAERPDSPLEVERPTRHATMADVIALEIVPAIEGGGAVVDAYAAYDVRAIAHDTFAYRVDRYESGAVNLNSAGYVQTATGDQFWAVVARHARTAATS